MPRPFRGHSTQFSQLYDSAGRRTRLTWPDGFYVDYVYDVLGEMTEIRENGATSGAGLLARFAYDDRGRRTTLTRGNGSATTYSYDAVSRLSELTQNLAGTASDLTLGFSYNPASQIASNTRSNPGSGPGQADSYAWTGHYAVNRNYTANGLNQYIASGSITPTYDVRGNLASAGTTTYSYDYDNRLAGSSTGAGMLYDGVGRMFISWDQAFYNYDGPNQVLDSATGVGVTRRYVFGPGVDEPLVWYEGSGTSDRRWLHADERGSIVAVSDGSGNASAINRYDEYGVPGSTNSGRFQYTGQAWLPEFGMYHHRARIYSPTLGRFLQTDPVGFAGGMNLYGYTAADPVNFIDPEGTGPRCTRVHGGDIVVCAPNPFPDPGGAALLRGSVHNGGTSGSNGMEGTGGEGGGGTAAETPYCRALREHAANTRNNLPPYISNERRYNNAANLGNDLITAQMNLTDANGMAWLLGMPPALAGTAGARVRVEAPSVRGAFGLAVAQLAAQYIVYRSQVWAQSQIEALQARLAQLAAQADGTCP